MKTTYTLAIVLTCACLCVFTAMRISVADPQRPATAGSNAFPPHGIELRVFVDDPCIHVGDPLAIKVVATNHTSLPVEIPMGLFMNYGMGAHLRKPGAQRETLVGDILALSHLDGVFYEEVPDVRDSDTMGPGKGLVGHDFLFSDNDTDELLFDRPGEYQLRVTCQLRNGIVSSRPITITARNQYSSQRIEKVEQGHKSRDITAYFPAYGKATEVDLPKMLKAAKSLPDTALRRALIDRVLVVGYARGTDKSLGLEGLLKRAKGMKPIESELYLIMLGHTLFGHYDTSGAEVVLGKIAKRSYYRDGLAYLIDDVREREARKAASR